MASAASPSSRFLPVLFVGALALATSAAAEDGAGKPISTRATSQRPDPYSAAASGPLAELLDVQQRVQATLPTVSAALVSLECNGEAASGIIVTPSGLVLTAAHVVLERGTEPKAGRRMKVFLADGTQHMGTGLGADTASDAGLLQLDARRAPWPCISLARGQRGQANTGDWCFALGHPGGLDRERGAVLRVGKVLKTTANSLQSDCVLMGGDSGGPLFSLAGELIGIHSQIWEGRDQNVHVSLAPFLRHWDAMKASEIISTWGQGHGAWLGIATRLSSSGSLEVADIAPASPAARAGLKAGDTILAADARPMTSREMFTNTVRRRAVGDPLTLHVRSRAGERTVTLTLERRPEE